ncbi:MAG: Fic family protein [Candidatus Giovannonibacteria bacterium]|nr:MAG: Fic family protein [Candidatus Giovannonibacteria bacterium]
MNTFVLESCLATPFHSFGGKSAYKGLIGKASMLFYLLVKNHPFQNGNKRNRKIYQDIYGQIIRYRPGRLIYEN